MADTASRRISVNKKRSGKLGKGKGKDLKDGEEERDNPFIYKILSESQVKSLMEKDEDELQRDLCSIMGFPNHETDLLEASQLDYYVGAFWWAKEQTFTVPQVSAFFTACNVLLENIKEKHQHILDNLQEMREMFAGIGVPECDTPGGLECFDVKQAQDISAFFHQTVFQHYKLHQYVFSHTQAEEIIGLDLTVNLLKPADTPYPAPLIEGLPEDVYNKYVRTPPPTPPGPDQSELDAQAEEEDRKRKAEERARLEADLAKESEVLTKLTPEEIEQVVKIVTEDTFKNLNAEMAAKLREREINIINRINKLHKVASG